VREATVGLKEQVKEKKSAFAVDPRLGTVTVGKRAKDHILDTQKLPEDSGAGQPSEKAEKAAGGKPGVTPYRGTSKSCPRWLEEVLSRNVK